MKLPAKVEEKPTKKGFQLPTQMSEPIDHIGGATILLYGERKIGKTSLASMFPETMFCMFEPGGKGLRIFKEDITDWDHFVKVVDALVADPTKFKTIVIDTSDIAYTRCSAWVCDDMGVDHPSEGNYGNVWSAIDVEFSKQMTRILQTGRGVVFVSHAGEKEFESLSGRKYTKTVPTMSKQAMRFVVGLADILAYYGYYGNDRYLTIRGSDAVESGHRLKERFKTPSGERVHSIPMGNDEDEAYANFMRAFNNQQDDPIDLEGEPTGIRERVSKMKSKK